MVAQPAADGERPESDATLRGRPPGPYRIGLNEEGVKAMAQTSILGRVSQLVRANINAILDDAEDPEKMLD